MVRRSLQSFQSKRSKSLILLLFQAAFVDVIHTDELRAGTTYKLGHVDFWVNIDDQMIEPGCPPLVPVGFLDLIFATGFGDESELICDLTS